MRLSIFLIIVDGRKQPTNATKVMAVKTE